MAEVLFILILVAITCSLMGSLLVVNNQSPVADALSHSILLGIVLAFFIVKDLDSPLLMVGASLFGLVTVYAIEWLSSKQLAYDAAIGLVFSFFFAMAVILISMFARNVHLDLDMVLMGEVLFASLYRMSFLGISLPVAIVKAVLLLVLVLCFIGSRYHQLAQYLLDPKQARLLGVNIFALRLMMVSLVSLTIVISFDLVGAISVVSFLVAPAMTALFWSKTLSHYFVLSVVMGVVTVLIGFGVAVYADLTMAGTCAFVAFVNFVIHLLCHKVIR